MAQLCCPGGSYILTSSDMDGPVGSLFKLYNIQKNTEIPASVLFYFYLKITHFFNGYSVKHKVDNVSIITKSKCPHNQLR